MKKPVMMETMNGILAAIVVAVVVGAVVVAETNTVVVGTVVVAETNTVVVGTVVALVIIIVWSMRRMMRITMTTMVGTMASEFVVATIMMMAVIKGQTAAIAVVMMAAGRVALWTQRNEVAKMYCLCYYSY